MSSASRSASTDADRLLLPRPPGALRRWGARHPRGVDWLVAGPYLLIGSIALVVVGATEQRSLGDLIGDLVLLATGGGAILLRRHPRLLGVIAALLVHAASLLTGRGGDPYVVFAIAYAVPVHRSNRWGWLTLAALTAVSAIGTLFAAVPSGDAIPEEGVDPAVVQGWTIVAYTALALIAVLIGVTVGNRRRYLAALIRRAEELAMERDRGARLAAVAERSRIAREMHDIVAHGLTIVITLAEAAASTVTRDPGRAAELMTTVADTGRSALDEARLVFAVLRDDDEEAALVPQPGAAGLADLVDRFRAAGLPVTLRTEGRPPEEPGRQLAVHRIVQESLTNSLRHATGHRAVAVDLRYGDDATVIEVLDDGVATGAETRGGGRGLVGAQERAALFGGEAEAGPRPGGGWRVRAVVPNGTATAHRPDRGNGEPG